MDRNTDLYLDQIVCTISQQCAMNRFTSQSNSEVLIIVIKENLRLNKRVGVIRCVLDFFTSLPI